MRYMQFFSHHGKKRLICQYICIKYKMRIFLVALKMKKFIILIRIKAMFLFIFIKILLAWFLRLII